MSPKHVVLVEPGAHIETGHYREKLALWWKNLRSAGYEVSVVCTLSPDPSVLPEAEFQVLSPSKVKLARSLPDPLRIFLLLFWTYRLAFLRGEETGAPVFGLTTSSLLPIALARTSVVGMRVPFLQILMYGNSFDKVHSRLTRTLSRISLKLLLRRGATLFPNTERTRQSLLAQIHEPTQKEQVVTLYDPTYIPEKTTSIATKQETGILLIPGPDDSRRSPLFHLSASRLLEPPNQIWLHAPGRKPADILLNRLLRLPKSVEVLTEYKTVEELTHLFASATWTLIAYDPAFSQGSGLLAQSLTAGTPVLCSRFPHAEELFDKFGKLGELFTFGDIDDFQKAWLRLCKWTSGQWAEFQEARSRFSKAVSAEAALARITKYLARNMNERERRQRNHG
jgi:hypothetical protein